MSITFYTNPLSRGRIVHWMLEELGVPYETRWIAYGPEGHKSAAYRALNPMGKLPTVVHDGQVVTEAAAIITYLALAFPDAGLGPTDAERADFFRWMFFAAGPLEQSQTAQGLGWQVPAGQKGMVGFGSHEDTVAALEGLLSTREHVCGERFTAADVYVGSQVAWGLRGQTLPDRPALRVYSQRVCSRAAFLRASARCDEEARKMPHP